MKALRSNGKLIISSNATDIDWENISRSTFLDIPFIIDHLHQLNPTLILKQYRDRLPKNVVEYLESIL